jgi:O-antigen biosynthesis protein
MKLSFSHKKNNSHVKNQINRRTCSQLKPEEKRKHVLFIGYVWPEQTSSAAGKRTNDLISALQQRGHLVSFASAYSTNQFTEQLQRRNVQTFPIHLNDSSFQEQLAQIKPDAVIFDRFVTEEQFSARVRDVFPDVALFIDTQDLHLLRKKREDLLKNNPNISIEEIASTFPTSLDDVTLREIASIYRADHSFLISNFEHQLLLNQYNIPSHKISHSPFFCSQNLLESCKQEAQLIPFEQRRDFVALGNFKHPPNLDQLKVIRFCENQKSNLKK